MIRQQDVMKAADAAADCFEAFREAEAQLRGLMRKHGKVIDEVEPGYTVFLSRVVKFIGDNMEMLDNMAPDLEELAEEFED